VNKYFSPVTIVRGGFHKTIECHPIYLFRVSVVLIASLVVNLVIGIRANAECGSDLPDYMSVIVGNNVPATKSQAGPLVFVLRWEHIDVSPDSLFLLFFPVRLVGFLRSEYQVDEWEILGTTQNVYMVAHGNLRISSWSDYRALADQEHNRAARRKR